MQILRLLAARRFRRRRRAVSTITATATAPVTPRGGGCAGYGYGCVVYGDEEDEGPFFDLDLSCCSAPASSAGSQAAESCSESEDYTTPSCAAAAADSTARGDLDFVISLHRSRSASPSYEERLFFRPAAPVAPPPPIMFCASEPSDAASRARRSSSGGASRRGISGRLQLRTLSFGSPRLSFAAYGSPDNNRDLQDDDDDARARPRPPPSGDVFRRYLSKISSRLRRVAAVAPAAAADLRLQKSRSASAAVQPTPPPARHDDSLAEKQDGIASAIAHCKESLHRASVSELDTSLLRSQSDPGP